jgi:adenine-specific DNA-methyltransferase
LASFEITRTELAWPGKYDDRGLRVTPPRVALPFQTIETINESRATREARKRPEQTTLFDVWTGDEGETFEEGWRNKLIWGNNLVVMSSLLERFAGKIDLIYIDPPFATGADFSATALVGESDDEEVTKAQSAIEEMAYRDTWGRGLDSYLSMLLPRLELMRDLLSDVGTLWVHLDWHVGHYVKLLLDEVFGQSRFLNEVVRVYAGGGQSKDFFPRKHEPMFVYTKGERWIFNEDDVRVPYDSEYKATVFSGKDTRAPGRTYRPNELGKIPEDWWQFNRPYGDEIIGYPTQKPEALLERIVRVSSNPGSIVADFFLGSGTTAAVAERLGRRWIGCDLGRFSVHTTRKRLMSLEGCKPFEVLNLGKYERQYWQSASFSGRDADRVLFEYIAFLLRLYGAEPLPGLQHVHGKRGGAVVHIGAVDAPVTISEVTDALDECVATGQRELHVLGWEWEMGLNDLVDQLAHERRVRLKVLAIPREVMEAQAGDQNDIRFFELAHLECALESGADRSLTVELTNFAMSDADAIDDEVRAKITKWSDFVDYWAVDFDFQNDTFMNGWVAYRTKKHRRLTLRSDNHRYPEAGTYRVAVKVVDIFGNDTTKVFPVEVK